MLWFNFILGLNHEPGKQSAWTVSLCYPLSCFSLSSFSGPPGKRDSLENFRARSRHHNTGIPSNWLGCHIIAKLIFVAGISAKRASPTHVIRLLVLWPYFTPFPWPHRFFKAPEHTHKISAPTAQHLHMYPFPYIKWILNKKSNNV